MGQKTHPKGFRLITTQRHLSNWYSNKFEYSSLIEEDFLIRQKVEDTFKELLSLSKIEITRVNPEFAIEDQVKYVNVTISSLFPREKEMLKKLINYFNESSLETKETKEKIINILTTKKGVLKRFTIFVLRRSTRNLVRFLQVKTKKNFYIGLNFIKNPFEDANLIAKFLASQLEKRVPFRRVIKDVIKKVKLTTIKGIKVELSGRLNGIDIARSEWKRDGKIPLHTLRANIDYTHQNVETIYGLIGIKIWLFIN